MIRLLFALVLPYLLIPVVLGMEICFPLFMHITLGVLGALTAVMGVILVSDPKYRARHRAEQERKAAERKALSDNYYAYVAECKAKKA